MLLGVESPEVSSFSAGPIAHYQQTTGVCGGGGLNPEAEADLVHARDWYTQQREGLGAALLLCVEEVLDRIDRPPEIYAMVYQDVRQACTRRFPYAVYYRITDNDVVVLGVFHTRRDPREWQARA
jgi:plasmid stabilization system protein ParE